MAVAVVMRRLLEKQEEENTSSEFFFKAVQPVFSSWALCNYVNVNIGGWICSLIIECSMW